MEKEMEQSLLHTGDSSEHFAIKKDYLSSFFELQSIEKGLSVRNLTTVGGHQALLNILKVGLSERDEDDQKARAAQFDDNKPQVAEMKSLFSHIIEQFEDKMLQILCLAAFVSLVIGVLKEGIAEGWIDGLGIFIAVIIIVSVTAGNNYMKDQQFRKLYAQLDDKKVQVLRSGQYITTSVYNLLVGDILCIETGDILSVDGLLLKGSQIAIDESPLTGESRPQYKEPFNPSGDSPLSPFLISGTRVQEGVGEMLVCTVGSNTVTGKLKKQLMGEDATPLQEKLDDLVDDIGKLGVTAAILTFLAMLLHFIWIQWSAGNVIFGMPLVSAVVNYFIIAVTIIVVAVPEGLPLAVTIALAYSVGKMKNENNLVRYLAACETMGGADNICSDKTGTLTMNRMTVTSIFTEEVLHAKIDKKNISTKTLKRICDGICINSVSNPKISINGVFEASGNPTECALLEFAYKMGYNYQNFRPSENVKKIFPFSSLKKKMSTIYQTIDNPPVLYVKGAPDFLLENCSTYLNKEGEVVKFPEEMKERVKKKAIMKFAKSALRGILMAYREIDPSANIEQIGEGEYEKNMTFIGIAGIQDPLREEIPEAVKTCINAGVTVRMVTGDNKDTATQIAKEANILRRDFDPSVDKFMVMEGAEFRDYVGAVKEGDTIKAVGDMNKFKEVASRLKVLARSLPEDKFLLVTGLKQLKHVVAVTGDGTNDAPALKKADVGFAMGITGTEIAKEAAGIILMDDNFKSIVTAIKWGRNIYECIQKFLQFQLTVNVVAIFMVFVGGVILTEAPLTSIQMLWVNLIMDTLASLALATEPPKEELLLRKPVKRDDTLIQPNMWRNILGQSVYQIVVLSLFLFSEDDVFKYTSIDDKENFMEKLGKHYTMFFNIFVFLQVFNEINARKLKREEINVFQDFFNNAIFLGVIIGTFVIQILFSQIGGHVLRCVPLETEEFVFCILCGAGSLVVGLIIKKIPDSIFQLIPLFREDETSRVSAPRDKSRLHMRERLRRGSTKGGSFMQIGSFKV